MTDKKKILEKLEGWEMAMSNLLMEVYQEGLGAGSEEKVQAQWVVEEIKIAYDRGFKEGQESALKSIEGSNQKIYEG